jgi:hypothetical protein
MLEGGPEELLYAKLSLFSLSLSLSLSLSVREQGVNLRDP